MGATGPRLTSLPQRLQIHTVSTIGAGVNGGLMFGMPDPAGLGLSGGTEAPGMTMIGGRYWAAAKGAAIPATNRAKAKAHRRPERNRVEGMETTSRRVG
jgi:hypothetical protein